LQLPLRLSHLAHAQQGVTGHYLIEAGNGVFSSLGLFETSEQGEESTKVVSTWIKDEHFDTVLPNAPRITSGKVVAHSDRVAHAWLYPRVCSAERARLAGPSRFVQD